MNDWKIDDLLLWFLTMTSALKPAGTSRQARGGELWEPGTPGIHMAVSLYIAIYMVQVEHTVECPEMCVDWLLKKK